MDKTTEFSFILKPSEHGIGVFAVEDIAEGSFLRLFGTDELSEKSKTDIIRSKKDVPEIFWSFCVDKGEFLICHNDFGNMPVGWYANHSKNPNAVHGEFNWYAARDISAGEEITIDYNSFGEPESAKKDFYKS
jgi:SET domain-containing protein